MVALQSANQVNARNNLSEPRRMVFDVEFAQRQIKTWVFCLLWLLLGQFGAHIIYMWIKDAKQEWQGAGFFIPAYLVMWGKILGGNADQAGVAHAILLVGVLIHGVFVLATGMLREMNDQIARDVASKVR
ncbi:MAG: hypothetical protein R3C18_08300 [Planctomycetaceae bacterium]